MVEQAQTTKPPVQRLVDKIASIFVPVVVVIAILTFLFWFIFLSEATSEKIHAWIPGFLSFKISSHC